MSLKVFCWNNLTVNCWDGFAYVLAENIEQARQLMREKAEKDRADFNERHPEFATNTLPAWFTQCLEQEPEVVDTASVICVEEFPGG